MWLWPSTPRALSDQWIAYDAEVFLLSVCAVFPCQNTRNAAFVVISPPGAAMGESSPFERYRIQASERTADAAGVHEGEPPLGYSRVIRCMNSTLVNPINEPTHNHHWLALRKEGFVG